tara:strand:+ start:254 stop:1171 length:918 start_codon:yes stop_codon:yes gene_type:complete
MSSKSPSTTTQVVKQEIPEWAEPYYRSVGRRGLEASNQKYAPYGGQRIAGFTFPESEAFRGAQGIYAQGERSELADAGRYTDRAFREAAAPSSWTSAAYGRYANPYTENVLDLGRDRLLEGYREAMPQAIRSAEEPFYEAGIVGGRQNVMGARAAGEVSDAFAKNLREYEAEGLGTSYDKAMEAFQSDRDSRQNAAGIQLQAAAQAQSLAQTQQNQAYERINALQSTGLAQREMDQAVRDLAYQDYMERQNYQKEQLNWFAALLSGTPYNTTNQSTVSTQPGASPISQGVGLATAGLGAYKMFNS